MDLMSLPNEMLASVFKYKWYHANVLLRKVNRRIDDVVKSYVGTKLQVHELMLENGHYYRKENASLYIISTKPPLRWKEPPKKWEFNKECLLKSPQTTINDVLNKINIIDIFTISIEQVDDNILDTLYKNKKSLRSTKHLKINSTFNCSFEKTEKLFNCFKNLTALTFEGNACNLFPDSKVFRSRKWDSLTFRTQPKRAEHLRDNFDNQFLIDVVQNCRHFTIRPGRHIPNRNERLKFSINGIVEAFKAAHSSGIMPIWVFEFVSLENLVREDVKIIFKDVPNYSINFHSEFRNSVIEPIEHRSWGISYNNSLLTVVFIVENQEP